LTATADLLEGLGVGEVLAVLTVEPVDRDSVKAAFEAVIRQLRAEAAMPASRRTRLALCLKTLGGTRERRGK
jgi:hypothetical protein